MNEVVNGAGELVYREPRIHDLDNEQECWMNWWRFLMIGRRRMDTEMANRTW